MIKLMILIVSKTQYIFYLPKKININRYSKYKIKEQNVL